MIQQAEAAAPVDAGLIHWRISTERYLQLARDGVFEEDRVELINGNIISMTPPNPPHNHCQILLTNRLRPDEATGLLAVEVTVHIADGHVYQPDVVLLKPGRDYRTRYPVADDLLLVVETANSSIRKDRGPKLRAYAAAGVADYWIADVQRGVLITHREPREDSYRIVEERRGDDRVSPLRLPEYGLRVGDLFE
ncbi:MAG: Uma2 family endonuclease [Planctomycetota bacterium]